MSEPRLVVPRVRAGALLARRDWDAVVVGSGVGALACAALLARSGMRVLVLERHYEPGGLSQTFRRGHTRFEVGLHYVGSVGPGSLLHRMFDAASEGRVRWHALPPAHDHVRAPSLELRLGGDLTSWRAQLASAAPGEERAIDRVLEEIAFSAREAPRYFLERAHGTPERVLARHPFRASTEAITLERLEALGCSPHLADLFTYAWGDYGVRRERSSFAQHAVTFAHYFGGAFHPVGGGRALGRALMETIVSRGGAVVVRAEVASILERDGRAAGVVLDDGTEVRVPRVVSGAGARVSARLLGARGDELAAIAAALGPSEPHVGLYVALDGDEGTSHLDGRNHWLGRDGLVTDERDVCAWLRGEQSVVPGLFVSTASALDARVAGRRERALVATLSLPAELAASIGSADPEAHAATRTRLAEGMLALIAPALLRDAHGEPARVSRVELSVPATTARYTAHPSGECYGLAGVPARFAAPLGPRVASLPGVFLTGQDVFVSGVAGAAAAGLFTATAILGRSPLSPT